MSGDSGTYIRGGGASLDRRRVAWVAFALVLATLVAIAVVLIVQAADRNSRLSNLQRRGVPVDVTVTHCVGNATGTGITVLGYACKGTFQLNGVSYTSHISGNADKHLPGEILHAIADPRDPKNVAVASSVGTSRPSWHSYVGGGIVLAVAVVLGAAAWLYTRRTARARDGLTT